MFVRMPGTGLRRWISNQVEAAAGGEFVFEMGVVSAAGFQIRLRRPRGIPGNITVVVSAAGFQIRLRRAVGGSGRSSSAGLRRWISNQVEADHEPRGSDLLTGLRRWISNQVEAGDVVHRQFFLGRVSAAGFQIRLRRTSAFKDNAAPLVSAAGFQIRLRRLPGRSGDGQLGRLRRWISNQVEAGDRGAWNLQPVSMSNVQRGISTIQGEGRRGISFGGGGGGGLGRLRRGGWSGGLFRPWRSVGGCRGSGDRSAGGCAGCGRGARSVRGG